MIIDYFSHIIGQEPIVRMLRQTIQTDKLNHAYLFWGPSGVGKKTTAQALARVILQLPEKQADFFPEHPDLLVIAPQEGEKSIGKNLITKELIPWLGIRPYRAGIKLAVLHEAQRMTMEASNALLKILEDPPSYAVIILIADQTELLPTIISRCQSVRFAPLSEAALTEILCRRGMVEPEARKLSAISSGNAHLAFQFTPANIEEQWQQAGQILQQLAAGQKSAIFSVATILDKKPSILPALLVLLRDVYVYQQTGDQSLLLSGSDVEPGMISPSPQFVEVWWEVQALVQQQASNVNKLMLYVNICFKLHHMLRVEGTRWLG